MFPNTRRAAIRLLVASAAGGIVALATAGPASAHVTITPDTTAAGANATLTVSVPHGCDGSPTTQMAIQVPAQILSVTPTRHPLWTVTTTRQKLEQPVTDAHGNTVTERDAIVTYRAVTPLPDRTRDAFELSMKLPGDEGTTLAFPTIQTCEQGETAWTQTTVGSHGGEQLDHPAPTLTITAAAALGSGATLGPARPSRRAATTIGVLGLAAGVAGLLIGTIALARTRRST